MTAQRKRDAYAPSSPGWRTNLRGGTVIFRRFQSLRSTRRGVGPDQPPASCAAAGRSDRARTARAAVGTVARPGDQSATRNLRKGPLFAVHEQPRLARHSFTSQGRTSFARGRFRTGVVNPDEGDELHGGGEQLGLLARMPPMPSFSHSECYHVFSSVRQFTRHLARKTPSRWRFSTPQKVPRNSHIR